MYINVRVLTTCQITSQSITCMYITAIYIPSTYYIPLSSIQIWLGSDNNEGVLIFPAPLSDVCMYFRLHTRVFGSQYTLLSSLPSNHHYTNQPSVSRLLYYLLYYWYLSSVNNDKLQH